MHRILVTLLIAYMQDMVNFQHKAGTVRDLHRVYVTLLTFFACEKTVIVQHAVS